MQDASSRQYEVVDLCHIHPHWTSVRGYGLCALEHAKGNYNVCALTRSAIYEVGLTTLI
jgi:hypothetical protein